MRPSPLSSWIQTTFKISLYGVVVGILLVLFAFESKSPVNFVLSGIIGFSGCWMIASVERFLVPRIRQEAYWVEILLVSLARIVTMAMTAVLVVFVYVLTQGMPPTQAAVRAFGSALFNPSMLPVHGVAFVASLIATFFVALGRKLGPGELTHWLQGRYRHPRQEQRVIMFVDLNDSTAIAHTLGDRLYSEFVQEFMAELTEPILKSGAQVSHYIGDEVVITWPITTRRPRADWPNFLNLARRALRESAPRYQSKFGRVPDFKVGVHAGSVIATEVGVLKSEIVFHGDALNVGARLAGLCRSLGASALVTRQALELASNLAQGAAESKGVQEIRGRATGVEAFAWRTSE